MSTFLYGLSVSSIQEFIFATGKLKEIIGASEFIEQVCGKHFEHEVAKGNDGEFKNENLLIAAAGKVAYLFESEEQCRRIVRNYVAGLKKMMPDLRIAQACVKRQGNTLSQDIAQLNHLLEINQSQAIVPFDLGLMISRRSRRTGVPAVQPDPTDRSRKTVLDRQQVTKRQFAKQSVITTKFTDGNTKFPSDINEIAKEGDWLAVVHADGNGMGKVVQDIYTRVDKKTGNTAELYRFSKILNQCTQKAAELAFQEVVQSSSAEEDTVPFRPLILGGDDLTVIIRGSLALRFTTAYLRYFEEQTQAGLAEFGLSTGLTACAGIAYIKPNYPIHYGMELAEELTKAAKNTTKELPTTDGNNPQAPSCLLFHKVQSSYVEDYKDIIERVLTAGPVRFNYGPYFIKKLTGDQYPDVQELTAWVREVKRKDAPLSSLRNWLSVLERGSKPEADQLMVRIHGQHPQYISKLNLERQQLFRRKDDDEHDYTHVYDVLTLASLQ